MISKHNNLVKLYKNLKCKRTATTKDPYLKFFFFFFLFGENQKSQTMQFDYHNNTMILTCGHMIQHQQLLHYHEQK